MKLKIDPDKAIKYLPHFYGGVIFSMIIIPLVLHFFVFPTIYVNYTQNHPDDVPNYMALLIETGIGILITWTVYVYSKKQNEDNQTQQSKMQKQIETTVNDTAKQIVEKVVDISNAQLRVKDGGKVALRNDGNVGADIVRNISESVLVGSDSISATIIKAKDVKVVTEKTVTHNADSYIVTEQKKLSTVDVILTDPPQKQLENIKNEIGTLKNDFKNHYQKKDQNIRKRTTKKEI